MAASKKEKSELKLLAEQAKKRMTSGYWKKIKDEREQAGLDAVAEGRDPQVVEDFLTQKCANEIKASTNSIVGEEEALYKKVCEILDRDEDIINPVSLLIDQEKYANMTSNERQHYTFGLMSKYCELKERYQKDKLKMQSIIH